MSWIRFVFLSSLVLFNSVQAVITLSIGNNALIGTPTDINWSRERGDPKSFDLHKFLDGEDYGFIAHIDVPKGKNEGRISVSFDEEGSFTIRAFDFEESQQPLAETPNKVDVQPFAGPPNPSGTDGPDGFPTPTSDPSSSTSAPITTLYSSTVAPTPTSTTPPNTASSTIAPTANASHTPSSTTKSPPHINAAAIAGGVIGGIVLLVLLTLGIILFLRRRRAKQELDRRFSFHRDLMVQARPTALSHSHPHLASEAPSPRLPRFSFQRRREPAAPSAAPLAHSFTPAHAGPTDRQLQLGARVRQLEEMMHDIRYRPGMSRVLEQLRVQVSWLRAQRNSPWALHQTDEKPLHYDLYMTS